MKSNSFFNLNNIIILILLNAPILLMSLSVNLRDSFGSLGSLTSYSVLILLIINNFRQLHLLKINLRIFYLSIFIIFIIIFLYLVTDYSSTKWLFNRIGYLIIFLLIILSIQRLNNENYEYLDLLNLRIVILMANFISINFTIIYFSNNELINFYLFEEKNFNNIAFILQENIGFYKQYFSILFFYLVTYLYLNIKKSKLIKFSFFYLILISSIVFPGIRTLLIAFTLLIFFLYICSKPKLLIFSISIVMICLIYFMQLDFETKVSIFDRYNVYSFAINSISTYPFGIGDGGYLKFVIENNYQLIDKFGAFNRNIEISGFFPTSTESDYSYYIISFGIFGLFFIFFLILFFFKLIFYFNFNKKNLFDIEKIIILCSLFILLSGISEDFNYTIIWVIFISLSFAIYKRI